MKLHIYENEHVNITTHYTIYVYIKRGAAGQNTNFRIKTGRQEEQSTQENERNNSNDNDNDDDESNGTEEWMKAATATTQTYIMNWMPWTCLIRPPVLDYVCGLRVTLFHFGSLLTLKQFKNVSTYSWFGEQYALMWITLREKNTSYEQWTRAREPRTLITGLIRGTRENVVYVWSTVERQSAVWNGMEE